MRALLALALLCTPLAARAQNVNLSSVGGVTVNLGQTTMSASLPVAISSNQSAVPASQSGTWNITNISGTVSLPTGAATSALQTTGNTALTTINTTLNSPMQNSGGSVTANLGTLNGAATAANQVTTPATGNGTTNANTQRVTLSSDGTGQVALASGTALIANSSVTTFQGVMTLTAATSTALTSGNVTLSPNSAALPAAGSFARLVLLIPSSCSVTVNWLGGTATATSGEQMGSGTNVGTETVNLAGNSNAPTLFSTAGCTNIQFRN